MIVKLIGIALVMTSATLIGWGFSECIITRERELLNISDAVGLMLDELEYSLEPVKFLFARVQPYTKGGVYGLFENISARIEEGAGAGEGWCSALEELAPSLCLKKSDRDFLINCSDAFFAHEAHRQRAQLKGLQSKIRLLAQEAGEFKRKNCKLVRMLGVYGGVMLCAVLF